MKDGTGSLNVSVAAAVLLYECVGRGRPGGGKPRHENGLTPGDA